MSDYFTIITIAHLVGVILGVGGAFASDMMFFSTVRDKKITNTELRFLRLGSRMVWLGLFLIIVSGLLIFLTDVDRYLVSSKFQAKMTIVAVLVVNGIVFHYNHIPMLRRQTNISFFSMSKEFARYRPLLLFSGVISSVSWFSALILGSLGSVPYSYVHVMGIYFVIVLIGFATAILIKDRLLPYEG